MHLSVLSLLASALVANAQSTCNPMKATGCAADKALGTSFAEDFSSESSWFDKDNDTGEIKYGDDGLELTLQKRYDNPGLMSKFYIMYGKVEAVLKAGPGTGIVSSFFLQSDDLDEIDLEWLGGDDTQFQSNYFSKGNVATYDRGEYHGVNQPQTEFHNYTIDWAMDKCVWYLDGQVVRTLANTTSQGYPQSPMFLKMGIWAGGDSSNEPGTIEWAGGATDYSQAPFSMYVKKVVVTDYSSGSEYSYGDQSGSWESIEAKDGSVYGRYDQAQEEFAALVNGDEISSGTSSSASSSSTSSSSSASSTSSSASSTSSSTVSSSTESSSSVTSSAESSSTSSSVSTTSESSSASSTTASSESSSASITESSIAPSTSSTSEPSTTTSASESSSTSEPSSSTIEPTSTNEDASPTTATTSSSSSTNEYASTTSAPISSTTSADSTLTTQTTASSTQSVSLINNAINMRYSKGLMGLLASFALALTC
ncbi:transglycosylase TDEL_0E04710 [Torulaspora delbrueckii]|uniref:Crh-like protein n=1 Tax=Torulaspora delbrueckii TaxID=4950 RepID=G8ZVS0_TORDE|nr:hypothetical protein TDEL_0E04710 [Torulaspora delbrueckii]CCE92714.1 hypothetical protein TDEL_0E04710 [Torulaspora delbrueckii]